MKKKKQETINMLLDIDHFYGESEGRLGPVLLYLCVAFAPVLLYVYYGLYLVVPIWLFTLIWILYAIRFALIIPGDESRRLKDFKNRQDDNYQAIHKLLRIKNITEDGCVEYLNNRIAYFIVCYNGSTDDAVFRSLLVRGLQNQMCGDFDYDIYIHNLTDLDNLEDRYSDIKLFHDGDAANDIIDMIDYNRNMIKESSVITRTVYKIKAYKSDFKTLALAIDTAISSSNARAFKKIYRVKDVNEINAILSKDIDGVVKLDEILMNKYSTGQYYDSKVLGYDDFDVVPEKEEDVAEDSSTFHVLYKPE